MTKQLKAFILLLLLACPLAAQTFPIPVPADATIELKQNGAVVYTGPAAAGSSLSLSVTPRPGPTPTTEIRAEPVLLDFGQARLGDLRQLKRVIVTNQSTRTITVNTRDRVGHVDFSIDRYVNQPLLPGRQAALDIAFRPNVVGPRAAVIRLVWDRGSIDVQARAEVLGAAPIPTPDPTPIPTPDPTPDPTPIPVPVPGEGFYVSPTGSATGDGTQARPWSLEAAVNGTHRARLSGGGTVWIMPGMYRKSPNPEGLGFRCTVSGTATSPLVLRAVPGSRAIIDGGFSFFGANHCWLMGVEVTVTDLVMGKPPFGLSGSWPEGAPNGGVSFYTSNGCKVINCLIYRNRQGVNLWTEAVDAEAYGNVIYDNGWIGSDRAHGHGLYAQNPPGRRKWISDNILTHTAYSYGWRDGRYMLHGYGERVPVTDIHVDGNIGVGSRDAWLMDDGAVVGPSQGHRFTNNVIHGVRVRLGSRPDQPLLFTGNVIAGELQMSTGSEVTKSGNIVSPPEPRPTSDTVVLRPNKYDPTRAHLLIVDWDRNGKGTAAATGWLAAGERVRVLEPTNLHGTPVWSGTVPAAGLELPVQEARVVIVLKDTAAPGVPSTVIREESPVLPSLRQRR